MSSLVPSSSSRAFLERASKTYEDRLQGSPEALDYLATRGLTPESVRCFRLGLVGSEPLAGHEAFWGRLSIPYVTRAGLTTMRYRVVPPNTADSKYLSAGSDPPRIYNPEAFFVQSSWIAVCEGEIDTITANALAGIHAVGIQGANNWREYFARPFRGYRRVYILADGDPVDAKTGKRAGAELAAKIMADLPDALPIYMPEGHDVNSFVLEHGAAALRAKIGL